MAKTGRMYTYDSSQNVTFPAAITSGAINSYNVVPRTNNTYNLGSSSYKWANVYATTIYENGTALSSKYQAAGNYAILDSNGKLADSVIPAVAITDTYVVDTETAMLALNAQKGDIAIRSDLNKSFVLQSTPASTLAN